MAKSKAKIVDVMDLALDQLVKQSGDETYYVDFSQEHQQVAIFARVKALNGTTTAQCVKLVYEGEVEAEKLCVEMNAKLKKGVEGPTK